VTDFDQRDFASDSVQVAPVGPSVIARAAESSTPGTASGADIVDFVAATRAWRVAHRVGAPSSATGGGGIFQQRTD